MSSIASKNLFELLGNSHDEDSDKEPEPPTRAVEKSLPRTTKRNAPDVAPAGSAAGRGDSDRGARGGRRGGFSANEDAFRDRNAGSDNNRARPTEDSGDGRGRGRGGFGGRGGRGSRGGRGGYPRDDRHSHQLPDTEKRINQGWGGQDGNSEWKDEQAGEAIAQSEEKEGGFDTGVTAPTDLPEGTAEEAGEGAEGAASAAQFAEAEVEDNHMSYSDYLVEKERKKLELGGVLEARKPNQGKQDKKWANAKELKKDEEDEEYIAGSGGKTKAQRERKQKNILDIDQRYVEPSGGRGSREGGFGRGGGRGGRGGGGERGDFRGGDRGRGGRGRGGDFHRGGNRGGYNNSSRAGQTVNVTDTNAFPVLGGS